MQQMGWLEEDIRTINTKTLAIMAGQAVRKLEPEDEFQVDRAVLGAIRNASRQACVVAAETKRPLVTIPGEAQERIRKHRICSVAKCPPPELAALNIVTLISAQRLAQTMPVIAGHWFGLSAESSEALRQLPTSDVIRLGTAQRSLITPVYPADARYWQRLLIGGEMEDARARRMVELTSQFGAQIPVRARK